MSWFSWGLMTLIYFICCVALLMAVRPVNAEGLSVYEEQQAFTHMIEVTKSKVKPGQSYTCGKTTCIIYDTDENWKKQYLNDNKTK